MKNWVKENIEVRDITCAVGLALLGAGLWQIDPAYTLIAMGGVILYISLRR